MSNTKQTAVDWLISQFDQEKTEQEWEKVYQQAKAMEKEQIIKAYDKSFLLRYKPYATAELYYNETFEQ